MLRRQPTHVRKRIAQRHRTSRPWSPSSAIRVQAREGERLVARCTSQHKNRQIRSGNHVKLGPRAQNTNLFPAGTNAIQERRSTNNTEGGFIVPWIALTSSNIEVSAMRFSIQGEQQPPVDTLQPRVTFFIDAEDLQLQTTISVRSRHHGNPATCIFQLPYISRPGQFAKVLDCFRA